MPRAPLTDEQKQVLRDRLAKAREAKRLKPPTEKRDRARTPGRFKEAEDIAHSVARMNELYTPWPENRWMSAMIEDCRSRLALLKVDFEVGSRVVGQRNDVNDPHSYRCFVCNNPIPESKWVWKQDYLDRMTNLYMSVVICNQTCHTVYINDTRLQRKLKDLMLGTSAPQEEVA